MQGKKLRRILKNPKKVISALASRVRHALEGGEVAYAFWPHEESEDEEFRKHSSWEVDRFLQKERKAGRSYSVLGIEAADATHKGLARAERKLNKQARSVRVIYKDYLRVSTPSKATARLFGLLRPPLGAARAAELTLAAKYRMRLRIVESYPPDVAKENAEISRQPSFSPNNMAPIAEAAFEKHDLVKAVRALAIFDNKCARIAANRYDTLLRRLPKILREESYRKRVGKLRCVVLFGGFNYSLLRLHRQRLSSITARSFFTRDVSSRFKRDGVETYRVKYRGQKAVDPHGDESLLEKAVMVHAMEKGLPSISRAESDLREYFDKRDAMREMALNHIRSATHKDFEAIAARHAQTQAPLHEILAEHFGGKK